MKMKLGGKTIDLNRVWKVTRSGDSIAHIRFITGETIQVTCGVKFLHKCLISYPGTSEMLKSFIEENKRVYQSSV